MYNNLKVYNQYQGKFPDVLNKLNVFFLVNAIRQEHGLTALCKVTGFFAQGHVGLLL